MTRPRALLTSAAVVFLTAITALGMPGSGLPSESVARAAANAVPFLAYYYIWFDRTSWDRAKSDFPALGRYSSDDPAVMRQHIRWAKAAGITGFIVSWKNTPTLDRRLETLMQVAAQENFKLAIIYEALDFSRKPLPAARVAADLLYFQQFYASNPVYQIFEKPLVLFSGTWAYTDVEVKSVTADLRARLLVLATEKNVKGYQRIQTLVDGDAYYWSSVNPDTYPDYQGKLNDLATAVHATSGLWIAPAAPGFNGTLLGGVSVVDRKDGATLRREVAAAVQSGPDAVGLISWNEFSENSYLEPSHLYGDRYLQVLSDIQHLPSPSVDLLGSTDDESPVAAAPPPGSDAGRLIALALLIATLAVAPIVLVSRQRRARRARRALGS